MWLEVMDKMSRSAWTLPEVIAVLELHGLHGVYQESCNSILNELTGKKRGWSSAASKLMDLRKKIPQLLDDEGRLDRANVKLYVAELERRLSEEQSLELQRYRMGYPSNG